MKHNLVVSMCLVALATSGCRPVASQRLVGHWEGRPDSSSAYEARQPFARPLPAGPLGAEPGPTPKTLLEQFDLRVTLQLQRDGSATLWRDDGQDRLTGRWELLESQGAHARMQLSVDRPNGDGSPTEVRIFELEFAEDGQGFRLSEEGADPHFGAMYFRPVKTGE